MEIFRIITKIILKMFFIICVEHKSRSALISHIGKSLTFIGQCCVNLRRFCFNYCLVAVLSVIQLINHDEATFNNYFNHETAQYKVHIY